jgi:hypothetical protein
VVPQLDDDRRCGTDADRVAQEILGLAEIRRQLKA